MDDAATIERLRDLLRRVAEQCWFEDYLAGKYNSDLPAEDRLRDEVRQELGMK